MLKRFKLDEHNTSVRQEIIAGMITFFSISYILFVHPLIVADAGISVNYSVIATILVSGIGTLLMGFVANVPLTVAPGMGVNAFFTYTLVASLGIPWQGALGIVIISSILFVIIAYTGVLENISKSIPNEMKKSITIGIGLFLLTIGLENAGFLVEGQLAWNWVGAIGILLLLLLSQFKIKGSFLIAIVLLTIIYWILNPGQEVSSTFSLSQFGGYFSDMLTAPTFTGFFSIEAIIGIFSLTMLLIFQTIGIVETFVPDQERINKSYQMASITSLLSGILGTSPAITVSENGAGVKEGARTGLASVTSGVLFFLSLFLLPLFAYIPNEAIGPIIIFTGISMASLLGKIKLEHWSLWIPVLTIVIAIPFTGSIVDGMAYGFIIYPIVALVFNQKQGLNKTMWVIAILFLLTILANVYLA